MIWLTAVLCAAMISYVIYVVCYANGMDLENDRLSFATAYIVIPTIPFVILLLTVFLLDFYYVDIYKVKKGKFKIIEEKLYDKQKEQIKYDRRMKIENFLFFHCGRVAVEDQVYAYSNVGDRFFLVVLRNRKDPLLAYHTKYYEADRSKK